ncbi:hypothetical protein ACS127_02750 [Amphibacillus sp. Q70]|uniref:hypothetical protein n=1 Tax=Amphibacillus sp. Q70 TaxID=3453416 RepID=UPI003F836DBA
MTRLKKARTFIYRHARPLDLARWQYHFENGNKQDVITCLLEYQNADGGFGHALGADCWNPHSSPIQTWAATEILREINFIEADHPIIKGILNYLASGKDFDGQCWYNTIKSNNDYPHAPWWQYDPDCTNTVNYNPTACLAGFIVRFADKDSDLYQLGCRLTKEAVTFLLENDSLNEMHLIACYIRLFQYIESAEADLVDMVWLQDKLRLSVKQTITQNKVEWETTYICKPSQFFNRRESPFYDDNREIAEYECHFIKKEQQEDGSWTIPWHWGSYPEQWAISQNWWKANMIIANIQYLKNFDQL